MRPPWPLTGRDAELRTIGVAIRPGAAGIVVAGPAGVGKTRLAHEAAARVAGRGGTVVWAYGSRAARAFPLGAFAGLVDVPTVDASAAVARLLDDLVRRGVRVLAVDDAHLLDELSAVVVHRVVVRGLAPVVVTVRDPAPDPVTSLWKDDLLPRLDLGPLDRATTARLVAHVLGGPMDPAAADRLWALTRGSPLYLRHLLAGEARSGRLHASDGVWHWSGDADLSSELRAVLEQEMGDLRPPVQDVLDLVTLAEPVAVATLVDLTAADAVEEAERHGLVRTEPADGGTARLAHPLYGEVRRAAMGGVRARRLRGLLASRLDAEADPIPRAVLTLDSDLEPDPLLLTRAARAAIGLHDLPLAERLARAAATAGGWDARVVHASALSWLSRGQEADAVLRDLVARAPSGPQRAQARAYRAGNLLWTLGRADAARGVLAEALADPDAGPSRPLAEAMSAALDASLGDAGAALTRSLALLDGDLPDDLTRLMATSALAAGAAVGGRLDLLDRAADAGAARGIPAFGLADWLVLGYRLAGVPASAQSAARDLRTSSADLPGPAHLMGLVLAGHAALAAGRVHEALAALRRAWAGLEHSGHEFRFRCRTLLATAYALAGDARAARPLLAGPVTVRHPAYTLLVPDDVLARAWGAAAEGAVTEAIGLADAAATLARRQRSPAFEVLARQTATQLGDGVGAVPRLEVLAAELATPRAGAALRHARALAALDGEALTAAADDWERLGDPVAAGDAAAQAADAHRRNGRPGSALSAASRAEALGRRSGARTPALAAAVRPLPLSSREREVAGLAGRGLTNRQIADRLTVSVRTVEGHLYRAGHKLGVSDRAELGRLVVPPSPTGAP